ncbi:heavy-metal-associated domain-containing protein [Oligella ureolytica]|jgi:mercuric ion binding protein|nr:heavy-metal-associated domain-containing protein [Alcaligenaceae bacterium]HZJ97754.1 cation transporter [Oligella sp.]
MSNLLMAVLAALSINGANQSYVIHVEGMHCPLCTAMVRKALLKVDGVNTVKASLKDNMARVEANEKVTKDSLLEAVATTGYEGVFVEE